MDALSKILMIFIWKNQNISTSICSIQAGLIINNLSSMKYFSFLASFGKLAYLDLSNKPL